MYAFSALPISISFLISYMMSFFSGLVADLYCFVMFWHYGLSKAVLLSKSKEQLSEGITGDPWCLVFFSSSN